MVHNPVKTMFCEKTIPFPRCVLECIWVVLKWKQRGNLTTYHGVELLTEILSTTNIIFCFANDKRSDHKFASKFAISGTTCHSEADLKMVKSSSQSWFTSNPLRFEVRESNAHLFMRLWPRSTFYIEEIRTFKIGLCELNYEKSAFYLNFTNFWG